MKEETLKNAAQYVRDNGKSAAIFWNGLGFEFVELSIALAGNYPIAEVLSVNLQTTPA